MFAEAQNHVCPLPDEVASENALDLWRLINLLLPGALLSQPLLTRGKWPHQTSTLILSNKLGWNARH